MSKTNDFKSLDIPTLLQEEVFNGEEESIINFQTPIKNLLITRS